MADQAARESQTNSFKIQCEIEVRLGPNEKRTLFPQKPRSE